MLRKGEHWIKPDPEEFRTFFHRHLSAINEDRKGFSLMLLLVKRGGRVRRERKSGIQVEAVDSLRLERDSFVLSIPRRS